MKALISLPTLIEVLINSLTISSADILSNLDSRLLAKTEK